MNRIFYNKPVYSLLNTLLDYYSNIKHSENNKKNKF